MYSGASPVCFKSYTGICVFTNLVNYFYHLTNLFIVLFNPLYLVYFWRSGFIRVREMSGKFKIFQGQGIVREFHNLSGKIEFLLKCQGGVREF